MQPDAAESARVPVDTGALFRRHAPFVAGFVGRVGIHRQDVDDIVQQTFLIAHQRGGYRQGPARPTTWLAEIAMRLAMAQWRRRKRWRADPMTEAVSWDGLLSEDPGPGQRAELTETLRLVQRALDAVDRDRRVVFVRFELEGERCEAIATALGIPVGTVYSRLNTARKEFMQAYLRLTAERGRPAPVMLARAAPGARRATRSGTTGTTQRN